MKASLGSTTLTASLHQRSTPAYWRDRVFVAKGPANVTRGPGATLRHHVSLGVAQGGHRVAKSIAPAFDGVGRYVGQQQLTPQGIERGAAFNVDAQANIFQLAAAPGALVGAALGAALGAAQWLRIGRGQAQSFGACTRDKVREGAAIGGRIYLAAPLLLAGFGAEAGRPFVDMLVSLHARHPLATLFTDPVFSLYRASYGVIVSYYAAFVVLPIMLAASRAALCYLGAGVGAMVGGLRGLGALMRSQGPSPATQGSTRPAAAMKDLPQELLLEVSRHLEAHDALALSKTCKAAASLGLPKHAYAQELSAAPNVHRVAQSARGQPQPLTWHNVRADYRSLCLFPQLLKCTFAAPPGASAQASVPPGAEATVRRTLLLHTSLATARGRFFALTEEADNNYRAIEVGQASNPAPSPAHVTKNSRLVGFGEQLVAWRWQQTVLDRWQVAADGTLLRQSSTSLPAEINDVVAAKDNTLFISYGYAFASGGLWACKALVTQNDSSALNTMWTQKGVTPRYLTTSHGSVFYVSGQQVHERANATGALLRKYHAAETVADRFVAGPPPVLGDYLVCTKSALVAYDPADRAAYRVWRRGVSPSHFAHRQPGPSHGGDGAQPTFTTIVAVGETLVFCSGTGAWIFPASALFKRLLRHPRALTHPAMRGVRQLFVMNQKIVTSSEEGRSIYQLAG